MYDEDSENRKLLYKYLSELYDKQTAKDLMHKYKTHLFDYHGLAWSVGKRSLEFFCMYFLQDVFLPKPDNAARKLAPVHYEMWHEAEKMFIKDEFDKLAMAEPRGCAKTTVFDTGVSIWLHCYGISCYTIVIGKVEQDSIDFIAADRQIFEENKYIKQAFGELLDSKNYTVNKLELELTNGTKIQALSSTSSIRGKKYGIHRPSVIISDDSQGQSDIITQEARDKKYNTWAQDTEYAGDKAVYRDGIKTKMATKFIVLGTILHRDCFMSRVLKNPQYKHILRRAVDFDVDNYFNKGLWEKFKKIYQNDKLPDPKAYATEFYFQHEKEMKFNTIWADKFNCVDLAIDYYTNPISFKQEMMNDASKIGEKWFKSIATQTPEEIEEHNFEKTMLIADPASSVDKKADYSAFAVGSVADNGFRYIRKGIIERLGFDDFCKKIIELFKKYPDITHIDIEKNLYMGADISKIKELIAKDPDLKYRDVTFINEMQKKNKDEKISTIIGAVNNGQIIFNADDKEPIQQILDFCGQDFSLHDDFPDVVSQFDIDVKNIEVIQKVELFDRRKLGL
jgi:hypothetical protein